MSVSYLYLVFNFLSSVIVLRIAYSSTWSTCLQPPIVHRFPLVIVIPNTYIQQGELLNISSLKGGAYLKLGTIVSITEGNF